MAQINPKFTIRSVNFGMLLLIATVLILVVRLTVASELVDSLKAAAEQGSDEARRPGWGACITVVAASPRMMLKPHACSDSPPSRETAWRKSNSVSCITLAKASPRMMFSLMLG